MGKTEKRILAMILILPFLLSAGCKKKKAPRARVVSESDTYFSCDEIPLDMDSLNDTDKELADWGPNYIKIFSDCVLVSLHLSYVMPEEFEKSWEDYQENWMNYSEEDRKALEEEYESYNRNGLAVVNLDGTLRGFTDIPKYSEIRDVTEDQSGALKVLVVFWNGSEYQADIYNILQEGKMIPGITLDHGVSMPDNLHFLENGNILCSDVSNVLLFNSEGGFIHAQSMIDSVQKIFQIDGKYYAYVSVQNLNEDSAPPIAYMQEIDPSSGEKNGDQIYLTGQINGDWLIQGRDGVYSTIGDGIRKYDLVSGKDPQTIISWSDTDCNHFDEFNKQRLYIASDDDIYMTRMTLDGIGYEMINPSKSLCLLHLHREAKNPHAGKSILYLAYMGSLGQEFSEYINSYNLNPSGKARIVLEDYSGASSLYFGPYSQIVSSTDEQAKIADQVYLDILNGDGPDILVNFGSFSQFNTQRAMVDLNTFIDGSDPLDRNLFFDNILRVSEWDGKLYQFPLSFYVTGMLANKEYVGERTGWTYDEVQEIAQTLPTTVDLFGKVAQSDLLEIMIKGTTSHFLDYDNRKVKFDDPEFNKILDLVKTYGIPKTAAEIREDLLDAPEPMSDMDRFDAGMIVAVNDSFRYLSWFGHRLTMNGGNVCFIGIPNMEGSGAMADNAFTVGITQSCPLKDEAWSFLRYLFEDDPQLTCACSLGNFPVSRNAFATLMEKDLADNHVLWEMAKTDPDMLSYLESYSCRLEQEHVDALLNVVENIGGICAYDPSAMMIIQEEAPGYLTGQRTVDDVVDIIQKRSKAVVQERG